MKFTKNGKEYEIRGEGYPLVNGYALLFPLSKLIVVGALARWYDYMIDEGLDVSINDVEEVIRDTFVIETDDAVAVFNLGKQAGREMVQDDVRRALGIAIDEFK